MDFIKVLIKVVMVIIILRSGLLKVIIIINMIIEDIFLNSLLEILIFRFEKFCFKFVGKLYLKCFKIFL